jgi:hypothetical protein
MKPGAEYNMFQILKFNIKLFKGRNIFDLRYYRMMSINEHNLFMRTDADRISS